MRAVASALLLLMSAPAFAQSSAPAATSAWWSDYETHARQVPVGGDRTVHLLCEGSGSPTVILENGTGDGMTVWRKVQPVLAQHYRVCACDRAGLGLSPAGPQPRDLNAVIGDLGKLMARAHLRPPYLLVGHSFGGLVMRLYARQNPQKVAGLVLVDPPVEGQTARVAKIIPSFEHMAATEVERSRNCASAKELTGDCEPGIPGDAPAQIAARLRSGARLHYLTQAAEIEGIIGADDAEIERAGTDLGDVPLIVLTSEQFKTNEHMPPDVRAASQNLWMTFHDEIAAHSKRGINRVVPGTGHYIQLEQPDAVIIAVEEIATAHRPH
jgi:pimeloyl-ACP methyl ester carboxylesterase